MNQKVIITLLVVVFLSFSCGKQVARPAKRTNQGGLDTYTIRGEILWKAPSPVVYPIPTTVYRGACGKRHAVDVLNLKKARVWHKRILNVAIWMEPVWEEMTPEEIQDLRSQQVSRDRGTVQIVERDCQFQPRIIVVPVGTVLEIYNEDRKDHWIAVEGKVRQKAQYVQYYGETPSVFTFDTPDVHHIPKGQPVVLLADKVDILRLISGFHRWMEGWVVVTNKFWFDESVDGKGIFEITGVPRGVFRIHAWHPLLGENSSVVRVPDEAGGLVAVNYFEEPERIVEVPSTLITTTGEIRQDKNIWQDIEDW